MAFHRFKMPSTPPGPFRLRLGYVHSNSAAGSFGLTFNQDPIFNKQDYTGLGELCAGVCEALDRGSKGRRLGELSPSVLEAIEQLTT